MSKPSKIWGIDGGALAMDGQIIVRADDFKPDSAEFDEGLANVRLAATAPEMLEALKKVAKWLQCQGPQGDFIRAVIAKAEGVSK